MTVTPELREPMLVQRRADGVTGFITSSALSLKRLGMDWPQQRIFRYREAGLDFYAGAILTTRRFAEQRPDAVRAVIASFMRSLSWAQANRAAAIRHLVAREPLTDVAIESERQDVAFTEMVITDSVRRNGLSFVEAPRLQRQIDAVGAAFNLARMPSAAQVYTDAFLPPAAQRAL
jgi:NitT/TauT family transport system substrate-binding protein